VQDPSATPTPRDELDLARSVLGRMAADLSLILERDFRLEDVCAERRSQRAVGAGAVHVSFKLGIELSGEALQGCLLVPLPDAVALAGYVMMMSDESVAEERPRTELDGPFKEALLEVAKFLASACDAVLRPMLAARCTARSGGCQGVRADVRPALSYREGDELVVVTARARVHEFEPFELILMLPRLDRAGAAERSSAA
jgi:hypothetical protein